MVNVMGVSSVHVSKSVICVLRVCVCVCVSASVFECAKLNMCVFVRVFV